MKFTRSFFFTFSLFLLAVSAFASGYLVRMLAEPNADFPLLAQAYDILQDHGIKELPASRQIEYGMIRGMLLAYDEPYTVFVEPPQAELDSNALQGSYGGIGVSLGNDTDGFWVLFPFSESPAAVAGIQEGDRLLAVEDLQVEPGTNLDTIQSQIRGPVGSQVSLQVGRKPKYSPVEISVERAEIPIPSVTWHQDIDQANVGILDVNLIAASTADELLGAVQDLQKRGATHFVLDLRDNPGGLLTAGVDIARLFLSEGEVIQQQYRGQEVETFRVEKPGELADLPLAVLINQGSASAAEIIAGALKAQGRAPVVGFTSYGKDSIQLVFELEDDSSLHVTAARWWVPGLNEPAKGNGIQPDIPIDSSTNPEILDAPLQAAVQAVLAE